VPFHHARADTIAEAGVHPISGKGRESIEEAGRRLRYAWFRQLMASGEADAVATAHTLDDQAETVLAKILRGAWTEGIGGIHPTVEFPEGRILRPLLTTTRAEIEAYLGGLGQDWRHDSSNKELTYTRNRIRHKLLPLLEAWNPRLRSHLAQMALLARDEEAWWQCELARIAPQLLLTGRPVRGGGRAASHGLALDVTRLTALAPALQRRLLRYAAEQLGAAPDFAATESLRMLALAGRAGQKLELEHALRAERTPRELRLALGAIDDGEYAQLEYAVPVPGEVSAPGFGIKLQISAESKLLKGQGKNLQKAARLRNWKPGDKVRLRHTSGPRKIKEVLERLKVTGSDRAVWPVVEWEGRIVWMKGVELEPEAGVAIAAIPLRDDDSETMI
jgi:tRNA(Ile)-lysidine synthase